ncbi:MAG: CRISPR-associated protein Cas4 [bacterium]|nr:CRISPR-associated protein Cas4 [bacterium]
MEQKNFEEKEQISSTGIQIYATLVWYYYICHRQVWYMSRNIFPDQDNPHIQIGKIISEQYYKNEKKEISLENMIIDIIKNENNHLVVGEIKKTSKNIESCEMQLCFYLNKLKNLGIEAKGILLFPKEKKKIPVELTDKIIKKLENAEKEIKEIIRLPKPPTKKKIPFCKNCGYRDLCWS